MQEEAIKRIPPHNVEAERAVIGSMIMDADAILAAIEMLSADDFLDLNFLFFPFFYPFLL